MKNTTNNAFFCGVLVAFAFMGSVSCSGLGIFLVFFPIGFSIACEKCQKQCILEMSWLCQM